MNYKAYGHAAGREPRLVCVIRLRPGEALDVVREDIAQPSLNASYAAGNWGPAGACARSAGIMEAHARGESEPTMHDLRKYHSPKKLTKTGGKNIQKMYSKNTTIDFQTALTSLRIKGSSDQAIVLARKPKPRTIAKSGLAVHNPRHETDQMGPNRLEQRR